MSSRRLSTPVILSLAALATVSLLSASAIAQSKRTRSDKDINAIGHRNVGKDLNFYSLDKEKELGKQLATEVERTSKFVEDPVIAEYVNRIAQKIAQNSDARLPITVRVIDSDVFNAFTLPGGFQYINTGLILQTGGEAELAGVLARGIAHTAIRSATKEATKGEIMQLSAIPLIFLGPGGWAGYGMFDGQNLSTPLTYLRFRRDAELAADYFGLQYLCKTGYDPISYVTLLERILTEEKSHPGTIPKVFSTHPPTPERIQNAQNEIAEILPPRASVIVSTAEFQEIIERLRAWKSKRTAGPEANPGKPTLKKRADPSTPDPHTLMPDCQ